MPSFKEFGKTYALIDTSDALKISSLPDDYLNLPTSTYTSSLQQQGCQSSNVRCLVAVSSAIACCNNIFCRVKACGLLPTKWTTLQAPSLLVPAAPSLLSEGWQLSQPCRVEALGSRSNNNLPRWLILSGGKGTQGLTWEVPIPELQGAGNELPFAVPPRGSSEQSCPWGFQRYRLVLQVKRSELVCLCLADMAVQ